MGDLYSELLVKKDKTAKDSLLKYGLIVFDSAGSICRTYHHTAGTDHCRSAWNCMLFCNPENRCRI